MPELMDAEAPNDGGRERLKRVRNEQRVGYRDVAANLIDRIQNGQWSVGEALPTELELIEEFRVGRTTVREGLRQLQDMGFIRRQRGTRSILVSSTADAPFVNSFGSPEELLQYSKRTQSKVLFIDHVKLHEGLAKHLGASNGSEWARVGILRTSPRNRQPLCYAEIYVEPKYRDVLPLIKGERTVYSLIEEHHKVVYGRIEQEIEAANADSNVASRLGIADGSSILLVRTMFYASSGRMTEVGLTHFPAGRYRVRFEMKRNPNAKR
jgi:GntR family transcriptional regulator